MVTTLLADIYLISFHKSTKGKQSPLAVLSKQRIRIASTDMKDKGVIGTTDWTKYGLTLDLNAAKAKSINIGAAVSGMGKA